VETSVHVQVELLPHRTPRAFVNLQYHCPSFKVYVFSIFLSILNCKIVPKVKSYTDEKDEINGKL